MPGLTLLAQAILPLMFLDHAFQAATYLINRMPIATHDMSSPCLALYHAEPDYKSLKAFGCACYPHLRPYNPHKFSYHSKECLFWAILLISKGTIIWQVMEEFTSPKMPSCISNATESCSATEFPLHAESPPSSEPHTESFSSHPVAVSLSNSPSTAIAPQLNHPEFIPSTLTPWSQGLRMA
ncbi:hypothetical protein KIW84_034888 [Lathyrus oleraceus]|uniref:Uncharacterized protein n=1 Tax=Pisum sativum TaxID=3888 RepID=A0A9D4Y275_PEA|nr:hypothetical protein KIW84_034888 [Pisum sativum]